MGLALFDCSLKLQSDQRDFSSFSLPIEQEPDLPVPASRLKHCCANERTKASLPCNLKKQGFGSRLWIRRWRSNRGDFLAGIQNQTDGASSAHELFMK